MRIDDRIASGGEPAFSFEFFPPRTPEGETNLDATLRALGVTTGKSLVEEDKIDLAKETLAKAKAKGVALLLPVDNILIGKDVVQGRRFAAARRQHPCR